MQMLISEYNLNKHLHLIYFLNFKIENNNNKKNIKVRLKKKKTFNSNLLYILCCRLHNLYLRQNHQIMNDSLFFLKQKVDFLID